MNRSHFPSFFILLSLILFSGLGLSKSPQTQLAQDKEQPTNHQLTAGVKQQSKSPMRINILKVDTEDSYSPQVEFSVTNISEQSISAYSISYEAKVGNSSVGGMTLTNNQENILYPSQSRTETINGLPKSSEPISHIMLMVDYVEFTNNLSWGPDTYQSAELLDGQRTGMSAERNYLSELLKTRGPASVIEAYNNEEDRVIFPKQHSQKWLEGFRSGKATVRSRLQHSIKTGTSDEIRSELQKIR
jgi:hypothetical protein